MQNSRSAFYFSFFILFLVSLFPIESFAHVKWFSNYSFQNPPLDLSDLDHVAFWGLLVLSVVSFPLLVGFDEWFSRKEISKKMNHFFDQFSQQSTLILRVSVGATLLLAWQSDSMVAPEITVSSSIWGWFQFALVLALLTRKTTPLCGLGMIVLYALAMNSYGVFHLLDYVVYLGVAYYLLVSQVDVKKIKESRIPILYASLGFSLCWVALEKIFYPYWGLSVLEQAPALTMGLPHDFFLLACAFVEFSLGYLLIICLLSRPLALVITLVFFTTTAFFGKVEVIGHTILHGALLVFIVKGAGESFTAPIYFHSKRWLRMSFAGANFILLFALLMFPYSFMAQAQYEKKISSQKTSNSHGVFELNKTEWRPKVELEVTKDTHAGWNLFIDVQDFSFSPESASEKFVIGEGHAHLYINGQKKARIYSPWFHFDLPQGEHRIRVTLNGNNHDLLILEGRAIDQSLKIDEDRELNSGLHQH